MDVRRNEIPKIDAMPRLSLNPSKQLLWFWLCWDMRLSKDKSTGIDAGCGFMQNKPMFRTKEYIGVDIDQARLDSGMKRHPEAKAVRSRIEDIAGVSGDFVLCVQVLHNKFFDAAKTVMAVQKLAETVQEGGTLVFNIGRKNMIYEAEIDRIVGSSFSKVKKRKYGAFASNRSPLGPLIAVLMLMIPPLRTMGGVRKILYTCQQRVGVQ